jgi:hypothetical protein
MIGSFIYILEVPRALPFFVPLADPRALLLADVTYNALDIGIKSSLLASIYLVIASASIFVFSFL